MAANDDHSPAARKPRRDGIDPPAPAAGTHAKIADARERAADAYSTATDKAGHAYSAARDKALEARDRAGDAVDDNPLAMVLGGIALGVAVGALLPATRRETEIYGPAGVRLAEAAQAAVAAARDAGREKLGDLGLSRDNAGASIRSVLDAAIAAATGGRSAAPASSAN